MQFIAQLSVNPKVGQMKDIVRNTWEACFAYAHEPEMRIMIVVVYFIYPLQQKGICEVHVLTITYWYYGGVYETIREK